MSERGSVDEVKRPAKTDLKLKNFLGVTQRTLQVWAPLYILLYQKSQICAITTNLMGIILKNITFKEDRALIKVQVEGCLTPKERVVLKQLLYNRYPKIKEHACRNSHGPRFDDCVETTSLAHVLEHVILEEMALGETREGRSVALRKTAVKPSNSSTSLSFLLQRKGENESTSLYSLDKAMRAFVAKTTNLGEGLAKIEMKYYDDISTLQAINKATSSLNEMLLACKM